MTVVDPSVLEMPEDPAVGAMPHYPHLVDWVRREVAGLTTAQLDFDDTSPDREWMWWSPRRQVSHIAWDALVFTHRRCAGLLWPDGDEPEPVVWKHHHLGREMKSDRVLDEDLFWEIPDLIAKMEIGIGWLERVVTETPIERLRGTLESVRGTHFWRYVIQTLPRGAGPDPERDGYIRYDLEGSLWMVFYEQLAHIRTIQRLKAAQGLEPAQELPRVGYLRLPEYWGDTEANGPSMERLPAP
ncbi:MAG: hypothetical protein GY929_23045 [Actinomycetia bacterium]|nr:hypothetical protein [Actinomycetes bacterium]